MLSFFILFFVMMPFIVAGEAYCPVCHMDSSDSYYVQLAYGQKVNGCPMKTHNRHHQDGLQALSHPTLMGFNMSKYIVSDDQCDSTCDSCGVTSDHLLDPSSGNIVTFQNFRYVCLLHGQKIYFSSLESRNEYLKNSINIPYLMVVNAYCGNKSCPDLFKIPEKVPTGIVVRDEDAVPQTGSEPFCSGSSVMVNGFASSVGGTCVLLLFQPFVLNTSLKYAFGIVAVFFAALLNEALVKFRERIRIWTVKNQFSLHRNASTRLELRQAISMRRYRNKALLALLHMCQMTLAYFLMLVAMTYESGLFVTLVGGFGAGYLLFKNFDEVADLRTVQSEKNMGSSRRLSELICPSDATVLDIEGMRCMKNCGTTVRNALLSVDGTNKANILFKERKAIIFGTSEPEELIEAVELVGFGAQLATDF